MATSFEAELRRVVAMLAPGEVVSYGDIAHDAGRPRAARAAGAFMAHSGGDLPWWRVVYGDGRLPSVDATRQAELLRAEGVVVLAGRVIESSSGRFRRRPEDADR
jgi:methylated-DNA-protein-cysteine methyltransferase-like protein